VTEVIAACPYYSNANGVGDYSFTKALIIELREFKKTRKPFTTGQLHGRIYGRVAGRWPEDGSERHENGVERYPAPIFIQLTPRSCVPEALSCPGNLILQRTVR